MNNQYIKTGFVIIVTLIFIYAFSASYTSNSIDNIAYVTALGIDLSKDKQNLEVTFEFMDTSSYAKSESSESSSLILDSVTATSISSAINLLNSYVGKEVNLSHCKVIIISEELAKQGISSEITELMNNIQVRPTTNFIISKCEAFKYIKNSTSTLEKVLTKYYDIFPNSSEYTGYTSNIQIGNFYNYLTNKHCGNLAILGGLNEFSTTSEDGSSGGSQSSSSSGSSEESSSEGSGNSSSGESSSSDSSPIENSTNNVSPFSITAGNSPITGERGTENIGLAVFNNATYLGDLTAMDTLCHTLINGEVDSFLLTIDKKEIYKDYLDINIFENTSPKISVDISKDTPIINIYIELSGRVVGIKNNNKVYEKPDLDLQAISQAVNNYLKTTITNYLEKTVKEFKCDINDFYKYSKRNFLTNQEWENYDWKTKYLNSKFNVNINADISYNLLNAE